MPEPRITRPGVWPPAPQHALRSWTVDGTRLTRSDEQLTLHSPTARWIPAVTLSLQTLVCAAYLAVSVASALRFHDHWSRSASLSGDPVFQHDMLIIGGFALLVWLMCASAAWLNDERLGRGAFTFGRSPNQVLAGNRRICGLGEIRYVQVRRQFFYVGRRYVVSFTHGDVGRGLYWRRPGRAVRNPERRSRILTLFRHRGDAEVVAREIAAFVGVEVNALWA